MTIREQMRADLREAMKGRQQATVIALRTLLAAIDNAEAVPLDELPAPSAAQPTEVPRRYLSEQDIRQLLMEEAHARRATYAEYERLGLDEAANQLRVELALLDGYLTSRPHIA